MIAAIVTATAGMQTPKSIPPVQNARDADVLIAFIANRIAMAFLFFLLGLVVRSYFVWTHPHFDNLFSVRGVPYSDAYLWVSPAISLAHGGGLGGVFRPGLSVLLALFYVWFGTSFQLIAWLHVVIGALTGALIYLTGARVFPRAIASAAALFFIFDPSQIIQTPQATTEPLGLLFFVGSVYCLLFINGTRKLRPAVFGGVFLALSNLTRPLTLLCAPFYGAHLILVRWLRSKRLARSLRPACIYCVAIVLTLSPWLVRQRAEHGVWTVSTNLAEALYGATSPKYKTWKYTEQLEADRDGIPREPGARYKYFIAKSMESVARYPAFYLGQVSRSYWEFLNSFSLAARSNERSFEYGQWNGLVESQVLFFIILAALLFTAALRSWLWATPLAGVILGMVSVGLLAGWYCGPIYAGVFILGVGMVTSWRRGRSDGVALLGISLAGSGLSDAIFNNAILYRAVLMTDWIFGLFYLAAFYFSAAFLADTILRKLRRSKRESELAVRGRSAVAAVSALQDSLRSIFNVTLLLFAVFVLAGSVRLLILNFGEGQHAESPRLHLSADDKRRVIAKLRREQVTLQEVLSNPRDVELSFIDRKKMRANAVDITQNVAKGKNPSSAALRTSFFNRTELIVEGETLSPFVYYFPAKTEFELRDRLFKRRSFDCSIFRTSYGMAVFPGKIPRSLWERPVILVGWVAGLHPNGARFGKVFRCVAIIPVLGKNGSIDYRHSLIASSQPEDVL